MIPRLEWLVSTLASMTSVDAGSQSDTGSTTSTTSTTSVAVPEPRDTAESGSMRLSRLILLAVLGVLALGGLLLRVWMLGHNSMDSDQATVGLMAREILHGHTYAFYWGQGYGGAEPYVVAAVSAVFGQSPLTVNATPSLLAVIISVLIWRIGLRLFSDMAALCAAVMAWIWSESTVWNSTKELGLHQICAVMGCVVLLEALRIVQAARTDDGDRLGDWLVLGLAAGVGFWASPEVVYLALPAIAAVLISLRRHTLRAALIRTGGAAGMLLVGCLPWIWGTLGGKEASFPPSPIGYPSRVVSFFSHVLPLLLGLRVKGIGVWEGGPAIGKGLFLVACCLLLAAMAIVVVRTQDGWIIVLALALFPFLYAAFPTSWFWNDGRYAVQLTTLLSLVVFGALFSVLRPPLVRWAACVVLAAAFMTTLVAFDSVYGAITNPSELTTWTANPNPAILALAHKLHGIGISHAYGGYWVANDLTFVSGGTVTVDNIGYIRNPPEAGAVLTADQAAWIFVDPAQATRASFEIGATTNINPGTFTGSAPFIDWLDAHGITYHQYFVDIFDIVVPVRNVTPAELRRSP